MANATKCEQIKIFISHTTHLLKLLKYFRKIKMVPSSAMVKIEKRFTISTKLFVEIVAGGVWFEEYDDESLVPPITCSLAD